MTPVPDIPLYEAVARKIEGVIRAGTLRPGDRVPSVRKASEQNGVSVTTVVQAYLWLENRGWIEARPKSGYFVRARLGAQPVEPSTTRTAAAPTNVGVASLQSRLFDAARMPDVVPLGAASPGVEILPVEKLARVMASVARAAGRRGIAYDFPPGSETLRREIARRALAWGGSHSPDEIVITLGGTDALALCLRAVAKRGDIVAIESPAYFGALQIVEEFGLKALEIPMHPRTGMDLDFLERALARRKIAACLATPNFNNPLGSLMPDAHKARLVEMLAKREVPLVEDDINGELGFDGARPRPAKAWDTRGLVMYCGSFSKTLAPGFRVGWAMPGRFFERVKTLQLTTSLAMPSLPQLAIAEFVANGGYDHHLRTLRERLARQGAKMREAVADAFPPQIAMTRPGGGFVLWVALPPSVSALALHERAMERSISIAPGPMFSAKQGFVNFIRLNCGHPWSPRMESAVGSLGKLVSEMA